MALHEVRGIFSHVREYPPWTPKRKAGGVSISPPAPPNDQKGGAQPLLFGLSSRSSDGAALLRSPLWLSTKLQLFYFDTKSVFLIDRNFFFLHPHKMFTAFRIRL